MRKKTGAGASSQGSSAEHVSTQKAFSQGSENYRIMFQGMLLGAFFQAADGRLIDVNPAALEIFGMTREEFLGRNSHSPSWDVLCEDGSRLPADEHPSVVALKTGMPVKNTVAGVFNHKTKAYTWLLVNAMPQFRPGEARPYQVYVTLNDITEPRQAQQEVELFKSLVESSSDAIGMATAEGVHYYQNRAFDDLFGHIGADPSSSLYVDEEVGRTVFQTIMSGDMWSGEVRMYAHDRRLLHIFLRAYANKDASGRIMGLVGIHTDITGRKRDEEALFQSQERYRLLTETSPDAIITADMEGRIAGWNLGAEKIYGFKAREIMGKDIVRVMPESSRAQHGEHLESWAAHDGPPSGFLPREGVGRRKDGTVFPTEAMFSMHAAGKKRFITAFVRDISERKQIEKKLHESEELFRSTFDNAPIGICIFNAGGEFLHANKFCEQCYGRSRKELMLQGPQSFLHPEDRKQTKQVLEAIISSHDKTSLPHALENRYVAEDGHTVYTKQHFQGVFDAEDTLRLVIVLTEDITAAKQLSLMNSAVIKKLKDVYGQLGDFCNMLPEEQKFSSMKSLSDYDLSPMESRIASLIFHGAINKAIAFELRLSENTVKHHITNIYTKFGVKNRLEFCSTIRANHLIL